MDVDKALYMKDFFEHKRKFGLIKNDKAHHILYSNLYNDFIPQEKKQKLKMVIKEIEEKTITISNDKHNNNFDTGNLALNDNIDLLSDNPVIDISDTDNTDNFIQETIISDDIDNNDIDDNDIDDNDIDNNDIDNNDIDDNNDNDDTDIDILGGGQKIKKIIINPNYTVSDN